MTQWTADQLATVRARYANEPTERVASDLGRTVGQVYQKAAALGIKKSPEYVATTAACRLTGESGKPSRFQPGFTPWNKGIKFESGGRSHEARFKPGTVPPNRLPVGHIRINPDGYQEIKSAPGMRQWVSLHRWNWKQAHGGYPPKGMALIFRDGDQMNCDIENLECITRAELMGRNAVHNLPKELALVCQLKGALNRQINKRKSRHEQ